MPIGVPHSKSQSQKRVEDEKRGRLEKVFNDLHKWYKQGKFGDYTISFKAGDPWIVDFHEKRKTDDLM